MTAVAHGADRPWDGRRLLRFLTSLALLALAVTLRLSGPVAAAEPVPPAAAVTVAVTEVTSVAETVEVAEVTLEQWPSHTEPAPPVALPAPVLHGVVPAAGDSRAPPTR
ncbi:hypothetical protein [Actinoplanes sp. HUAS TT8]|uniref:hypothetical protein n=1 Tax=Actinoplanes sp. HUAS TT8 TaxID=3447453 RepID=UPI003F526A2F